MIVSEFQSFCALFKASVDTHSWDREISYAKTIITFKLLEMGFDVVYTIVSPNPDLESPLGNIFCIYPLKKE